MKKVILFFIFLAVRPSVFACISCNKQIRDGIYNSAFYPNLLTMFSAFIALAVIVALLATLASKRHRLNIASYPDRRHLSPVPLTTASIVLGIGMGGFIDGILLHQILQWHGMLSNKISATEYIGKSVNMFWDGIFHAFCLVVVLIGAILLWSLLLRTDIDRSGKLFTGGLVSGWGLFNIVEGVIDHQILKLHNVLEYSVNHNVANYTFLGVSVVMIVGGYWLARSREALT